MVQATLQASNCVRSKHTAGPAGHNNNMNKHGTMDTCNAHATHAHQQQILQPMLFIPDQKEFSKS